MENDQATESRNEEMLGWGCAAALLEQRAISLKIPESGQQLHNGQEHISGGQEPLSSALGGGCSQAKPRCSQRCLRHHHGSIMQGGLQLPPGQHRL